MRYDFSDRPLYRFSERSIEDVFGDRTVAGAFILHISRSLYAGTTCVMAAACEYALRWDVPRRRWRCRQTYDRAALADPAGRAPMACAPATPVVTVNAAPRRAWRSRPADARRCKTAAC